MRYRSGRPAPATGFQGEGPDRRALRGLRASSDRITALDDWGLATTRRLLSQVPPPTPFT
jgi:hypothetical protein